MKVSDGGKLTAHFNSYSPVAIIATTVESAQTLVNTYNHGIGSDEIGAAAGTTAADGGNDDGNDSNDGGRGILSGIQRNEREHHHGIKGMRRDGHVQEPPRKDRRGERHHRLHRNAYAEYKPAETLKERQVEEGVKR